MRPILAALASGLIFGLGLGVAGMTQADKVIDFLDLGQGWDPSLALVMGGAIAVHLALFRWIVRRPSPLFAERFGLPTRTDLDLRLILGAAIFGVGWAIGGYCPGPGLVSVASGGGHALVFVATMTGGMLVYHTVEEALRGHETRAAPT